jgi:hypothetical protein
MRSSFLTGETAAMHTHFSNRLIKDKLSFNVISWLTTGYVIACTTNYDLKMMPSEIKNDAIKKT